MSIAAALRAQVSTSRVPYLTKNKFLDDMRTRLEDLQNELDSIAYPVLTLPHETTSQIFIHCLPSKRFSDVFDPGEAPSTLTRATFDIEATATFLVSLN
ncbi:hypothetical protein B0H14DRAFT_3887178 [Mycena olivaceomarginata]|nr:hypothetical protein B0H14DRAFT_3887178 [Mycena olivaceomarginata]